MTEFLEQRPRDRYDISPAKLRCELSVRIKMAKEANVPLQDLLALEHNMIMERGIDARIDNSDVHDVQVSVVADLLQRAVCTLEDLVE